MPGAQHRKAAHWQPAGERLKHPDVDAEGRRVDELRLDLVRAVGGQTPVEWPAVATEQRERGIEGSADVRFGASVLVGFRQARVIAVQATPDVARGERPVAVQLLPPDELHGIVIADGLGIRHAGNCLGGAVVPGVADDVRRVAHRIDRPDVLDGPVELFVNEPRRHGDVWRHLVLEAQGQLLHPHRLEIGVDVVERGVEKHGHSRLTARARWRALGAADQARPVVRLEFEGVDRESQAPEGGLGHGQLEDVVEDSPAAVDFPEAIARDVPGRSSPWRKLVTEREVDRLDPLHAYLAVERDRLVFGPQAGVDRQPAAHRPGVLHEQADGVSWTLPNVIWPRLGSMGLLSTR